MKCLMMFFSTIAVMWGSFACAQQTSAANGALDWITGHWRADNSDTVSEEIWSTGEGGIYFAVNRTIVENETKAFEFLRIDTNGEAAYIAQPSGNPPVAFPAIEIGENRAVFSNPSHDFPTHVEYVRDGDILTARIWGADGDGKAIEFQWRLVR